ncbi:MAG: DUF4249 domain-containing protein [Porphyromonas sp.]|nr:DUF4249 domain-containing protein [Porphyromonas sp.]
MRNTLYNIKRVKTIGMVLLSALLFSRCVDDIPMDISSYKEELIVNAIFETSLKSHYIYVSRTGLSAPVPEKDATIKLFINGVQVKDPSPHTIHNTFPREVFRPCFLSTEEVKPGDRLRLEVTTKDGKHHATAETIIPESVGIDKIKWNDPKEESPIGTLYTTFTDPKGEANFYQLRFAEEGIFEGKSYRRMLNLDHSQEPVMNDGNTSSRGESEDFSLGSPDNIMGVFNDKWINGTYTLKSGIGVGQMRPEKKYYVLLSSIPEGFYFYLRAINALEWDEFIEGLSTPIMLPSNVQGGKGYVAGISTARIQFSKK